MVLNATMLGAFLGVPRMAQIARIGPVEGRFRYDFRLVNHCKSLNSVDVNYFNGGCRRVSALIGKT